MKISLLTKTKIDRKKKRKGKDKIVGKIIDVCRCRCLLNFLSEQSISTVKSLISSVNVKHLVAMFCMIKGRISSFSII